MSQTDYPTKMPIAFAGMLADDQTHDTVSRTNVSGAAIPFGVAVERVADGTVQLPNASGDSIVGLTQHSHAQRNGASGVPGAAIGNGDVCNVMRQGVMWVQTEGAVTQGGSVFVRHAANGGNTQLGALTGTDDSPFPRLLANARWLTSTTGAGLAQVELRGSIGPMS